MVGSLAACVGLMAHGYLLDCMRCSIFLFSFSIHFSRSLTIKSYFLPSLVMILIPLLINL